MKVRSRILWSALTVVIASGAYVGLLPSDPSVPKAAAVTVPTLNVPAGFTATPILGSTGSSTPRFTNPTAVRFAPDGRVFVAEKTGVITVFLNVNATTGTTFADLSGEVMDYWDRGLIGLAVDPQLLTGRPYVYVSYTDDLDPSHAGRHWGDSCPTPPGATTDGCTVTNRIARLTVSNNGAGNTMVAGSEKILIDGWCQQFPSHSIGDIRIGSDGNLWATGGEGGSFDSTDTGDKGGTLTGSPNSTIQNPCADPAGQGGALRAQSVDSTRTTALLSGTAIRVDPDTGLGVPGNPMYGQDPGRSRIVAYGFRNPFRWTFKPGTSQMWIGNVGFNSYEAIDVADPLGSGQTSNFGWPCDEGFFPTSAYVPLNLPTCTNLANNPSLVKAPYYAYGHGDPLTNTGACTTANGSSITGLAFAPTSGVGVFPSAYSGGLFFGDYSRGCIYYLPAQADGTPDPNNVQLFASGPDPVDLQFGPDGALYTNDFATGAIYRISANGSGAQPPVAQISASTTAGAAGTTVQFSAAGSTDPQGLPLTYTWDANGNGVFNDAASGITTSYTYAANGTYNATVKVTDSAGLSSTASISISIGKTVPVPIVVAPATTSTWQVGQLINFSATAIDPTPLPDSAFTWDLVIHHCPKNANACHIHDVQTFTGRSGSFNAPDHEYPSWLELTLTVNDPDGLSASRTISLYPKTVDIVFCSLPGQLTVGAGTIASATSFTKTVILHSEVDVAAATDQVVNGTDWGFIGWSDGGARVHAFIADSARTLTATYADPDRATGGIGVTDATWQLSDLDATGGAGAATTVSFNNRLHVFYRDGSNRLTRAWFDPTTGWHVDHLGTLAGASQIQVIGLGIQLHVFYRDAAMRLAHTYWSGAQWITEILDGASVDGISVVNFNASPQVFYRRAFDGRLMHQWFNGTSWQFDNPGGALVNANSGMAATTDAIGAPMVVFQRPSGPLRALTLTWGGWVASTIDAAGGNGATAINNGVPAVMYVGADGALHAAISYFGWHTMTVDPATGVSGLSSTVVNGVLKVSYVTGGGTVRVAAYNGTAWSIETVDGPGSVGAGNRQSPLGGQTAVAPWFGHTFVFYTDAGGTRLSDGLHA